jgi:hypothetical protein
MIRNPGSYSLLCRPLSVKPQASHQGGIPTRCWTYRCSPGHSARSVACHLARGSRVSWILTSSGEAQMSQMQSLALAYDRSDPKHPYAWREKRWEAQARVSDPARGSTSGSASAALVGS